MKKLLVIGSSGTLGQALVKEFSMREYEVFAWDKRDIDVTRLDDYKKIETLNPEIIINATAYNSVDKAEIDENETNLAFLLNGKTPGMLAEVAKKMDAIFVHYSSNYVFDGENKNGYTESDIPVPVNKYGNSKLEGEKWVKKVDGKYYIIRLSRLFGIRGISEQSKRTFVEIMMNETDKTELEVGNTEHSAITYAPDLAKLTREIIESKKPWGIYHGANEGDATWYDWASEIFRDLGRGPKVVPVNTMTPKTTKHPHFATLINTKLPKQRTWQEATKEFIVENFK